MATSTKTSPRKSTASKAKSTPRKPKGDTQSFRDTDKAAFSQMVRSLKKEVGPDLAHTFAHLSWVTNETDPASVSGTLTGNTRRNDAVSWLNAQGVITEPIPNQVSALVTALREAGADSAVVDKIADHYGVNDLI